MNTTVHPCRVLAVLGPGRSTTLLDGVAQQVGAEAARAGWVVLTGGGGGVMAAACRGAAVEGGLTVAVLPTERPAAGYPNPWVRLPIFTGTGSGRNNINVLSAELCVAIGGGSGTLSEIALALKARTEVWCFGSWVLQPPEGYDGPLPRCLVSEEELLAELASRLCEKETAPR